MSITDASALLETALSAWRTDPQHAVQHIDAALSATGDLQRALIAERLRYDELHHDAKGRVTPCGMLSRHGFGGHGVRPLRVWVEKFPPNPQPSAGGAAAPLHAVVGRIGGSNGR